MAQWVNRLRNNIFVNPPPLPLSCEISGALHLAQPGLTAGSHGMAILKTELRMQKILFNINTQYFTQIMAKSVIMGK